MIMSTMSLMFFGLMLIPLIVFLFWLIKKDKKRDYIGLLVLILMAILAIITIVKFDSKFMESRNGLTDKSQSPSYK
jgi:Na+/proline symporter